MINETFYLSQVVDRAVKRLRADGVNIKSLCSEISDVYYMKLYDKMRKRGTVSETFLLPIIERHPVFQQYLSLASDELASTADYPSSTERAEPRSYPTLDKIERRIDQLMDETREYRRLLEQQIQANTDMQREKESLTKELIEILKKKAGL